MSEFNNYDKLQSELTNIAEAVKEFSEELHDKVFDILVVALLGEKVDDIHIVASGQEAEDAKTKMRFGDKSENAKFPGVATYRNGNFHLTVRDLKADSKKDAAIRLIYVLIYTYMKITGEEGVSRKELINPTLEKWRLYDGNARSYMSSDGGILKDDDLYSLDQPAEQDAEKFIKEIQNDEVSGSWSPSSVAKTKKNSE